MNTTGERFVAEDNPSVDAREHALLDQPNLTFWIVYDDRIRREAPPLIADWDEARFDTAFAEHPSFQKADIVASLAAQCDIEPGTLSTTIAEYNAAVESGDDRLGRKHMPARIEEAPYYAIRSHGVVLRTVAGLAVNADLQVLDGNGKPIPNLYAAGEILGSGIFGGRAFVGGVGVTPAVGFGRLLGRKLA